MEQCTTTSSEQNSATEDELLVSRILFNLEKMIVTSESRSKFVWGCTRRRTSLDVPPSLSSAPAPTSKSPLVERTEDEIEVRRPQVKAAEERTAAASPTTPLSFSPSESDENSNHCSKKRSRDEFTDMIEGYTERGDLVIGKIQNVRKYFNKLKAYYNSELKAMKEEVLNTCPRKEEPLNLMEMNRFMNLGMDLSPEYRITVIPHHQPLIADQKFHHSFGLITTQVYSSNNGFESVNRVGPVGTPDLDLSAEVVDASQPFDVNTVIADKRARFAEARRLRRGIMKIKSMRSACGIKLPRTSF